jgi:hypothetical protein
MDGNSYSIVISTEEAVRKVLAEEKTLFYKSMYGYQALPFITINKLTNI